MSSTLSVTPVRFTWHSVAQEQSVSVIGSWTDWRWPFLLERKGQIFAWEALLAPGRYEYKFLVDGVWSLDPSLPTVEVHGHRNHPLTVHPAISVLLKPNTGPGRPYGFCVNPLDPVEETVQRALQVCHLEQQAENFQLLMQTEHGKVSVLASHYIFNDALLYLCLKSAENDTNKNLEKKTHVEKSDELASPPKEHADMDDLADQMSLLLVRTDTDGVVWRGKSFEEAQTYARTNPDKIPVPLRLIDENLRFKKAISSTLNPDGVQHIRTSIQGPASDSNHTFMPLHFLPRQVRRSPDHLRKRLL